MTVIAYRDGTIACDGLWTDNGAVASKQTKVFRLRSGALYGSAGESDDRALVRLLQNVKTAAKLPTLKTLAALIGEVSALLVLPNGEVWRVDTGKTEPGVYRVAAPFAAVGSGADIAIGAMAAGATAAQAAAIACDHVITCRPPIYAITRTTQEDK